MYQKNNPIKKQNIIVVYKKCVLHNKNVKSFKLRCKTRATFISRRVINKKIAPYQKQMTHKKRLV